MAKIAIIVEYEPNPENYLDCETIEECVAQDVGWLNDGSLIAAEFVSYHEFEAKVVTE